ncbi:MAG TPA: PQQ-dependent sugar dehydrogenase [Candidatus Limnocylindrales bacterium]|nr:PQQ-dependent sugar dehydrogenase [Candidatus Limnocylindrales bacterium]
MMTRTRIAGGAATLVLLGAMLVAAGTNAQAAVLPAGFAEQIVFSGLSEPTNIEFANDGRIFVAEKGGVVKYFDNLADTTPTVFANLSANVHNQWDRGLLGMALAPNFPTDPWVYLLYTYDAPPGQTAPVWNDDCNTVPGGANGGNCVVQGRLSRIQAGGGEQVLIQDWCQQFPSHSIGDLHFGADGKLYVTGGDGGSFSAVDYGQFGSPVNPCADPANEGGALRSQDIRSSADPTSLDGAVLRLEPSTGAAAAGNPNIGSPDLNTRRIVANGLRNPFRFTFRPGTNEVWVGDVGWGTWEEIDRLVDPVAPTTNFGWPCYEGVGRMSSYDNANLPLCETLYTAGGVTAPYFTYNHASDIVPGEGCATGGDAVAGLAFYPGSGGPYPAQYQNALFFADYSRGCVWAMKPTTAGGLPSTSNIEIFIKQAAGPVDLAIGPGGELYYVDLGGTVRRIRYTPGNQAPVANISASQTSGPAPLAVNFNGTGSTDADPADAGRLTYQWDFTNDGVWDATSATASFTYDTVGVYTAKLRVTDTLGAFGESTIQIQPGNSAPTAFIDTPVAGTTWKVGDTITFSGHATDPQQGTLPASALTWQLRIQHCESVGNCHTHIAQTFTGVASGQFIAPDHEYPSYLELQLVATDAQSLTNTVVRQLNPETVQLTFNTNPSGLQLSVGSFTGTAPFTREVIKGSTNTVSAPTPQAGYAFSAWSDGGAQTHVITAPTTAATYTAAYVSSGGTCASSSAYQCTTATAPFIGAANQIGLGGDDNFTSVVLPFSMPLYGNNYSRAYIDTNGVVSFVNPGGSNAANANLPSVGLPNAAIYPFWADLVVDGSASVRTEVSGTSPNRRFVIEWRNLHVYGGTDRVTFSAVLNEDGTITFHYAGIDATPFDRGAAATVGIENAAGNAGLVYSFNQQLIQTGTAVTYTPPLAPLTNVITGVVTQTGAGPTPGVTVTLNPGGVQTTTGADGGYSFTRVPAGSYTVTASGACVNSASANVVMDSGTKTVNLTAVSRSDSFGYQCAATTGPFVSAANVLGLSGDDNVMQITLPFAVSHYGTSYTTAWVDTNGYISFVNPGDSRPMSSGLPGAVEPNGAVYGFWDDFVVDGQASIRTETVGTAPNRRFIVEWRNVYFYNTSDRVTFSVVLGEDGSFTTYYSGIDSNLRDRGEMGTVGIENSAGTVALQYSNHQLLLGNGYVIRFWRP